MCSFFRSDCFVACRSPSDTGPIIPPLPAPSSENKGFQGGIFAFFALSAVSKTKTHLLFRIVSAKGERSSFFEPSDTPLHPCPDIEAGTDIGCLTGIWTRISPKIHSKWKISGDLQGNSVFGGRKSVELERVDLKKRARTHIIWQGAPWCAPKSRKKASLSDRNRMVSTSIWRYVGGCDIAFVHCKRATPSRWIMSPFAPLSQDRPKFFQNSSKENRYPHCFQSLRRHP